MATTPHPLHVRPRASLAMPHRQRRRGGPVLLVLAWVSLLAACTPIMLERAPERPDTPWAGPAPNAPGEPARGVAEADPANGTAATPTSSGYGVPRGITLPALQPPAVPIDPERPMDLVELIDIAQRENPLTRQAWNAARSAALGVGMVEATFLPVLSANVLAGKLNTRYPLKHSILGHDAIHVRNTGVMPLLALSWLLFDFGQRAALLEGAEQASFAANVLFNAAHQKVIHDVTEQYYQYSTARERVDLAQRALNQQKQVLAAAQARLEGGVGTSLDTALARQAVAQARLHEVNSQGLERTTRLALLRAMGLSPDTPLKVAEPAPDALPPATSPLTRQALQQALSQRPDLVAQYAAVQAARANVRASEADFLPKVFLGAAYGYQRNGFQAGNLPQIQIPSTSNGVMVGVTLPLFDGGLRRSRLRAAEIDAEQAQNNLQSLQRDALNEMVAAETALQSALQSHDTAVELVKTARTAYDAALASYREGLGTLTVATEAATQLLQARQARADARMASQIAAANLAFATGAMIRPQENWLPLAATAPLPPAPGSPPQAAGQAGSRASASK